VRHGTARHGALGASARRAAHADTPPHVAPSTFRLKRPASRPCAPQERQAARRKLGLDADAGPSAAPAAAAPAAGGAAAQPASAQPLAGSSANAAATASAAVGTCCFHDPRAMDPQLTRAAAPAGSDPNWVLKCKCELRTGAIKPRERRLVLACSAGCALQVHAGACWTRLEKLLKDVRPDYAGLKASRGAGREQRVTWLAVVSHELVRTCPRSYGREGSKAGGSRAVGGATEGGGLAGLRGDGCDRAGAGCSGRRHLLSPLGGLRTYSECTCGAVASGPCRAWAARARPWRASRASVPRRRRAAARAARWSVWWCLRGPPTTRSTGRCGHRHARVPYTETQRHASACGVGSAIVSGPGRKWRRWRVCARG
jgi:hypothetical protein